ncbi:hypothetical protein NON20_26005 (plasmid) [Synechocystis sp. B12]|nr:hypothetical protein NON20_26005 [Synechocystis sp. B12]
MKIIKQDQFAFLIPELPSRYRANCSREWGMFVGGETKGMTAMQAKEVGLTKGNFVEMALCWTQKRTLTFEPNYINEPFTEIWGIPTAGEMKAQFGENASELSTFLIHRQSKDRMGSILSELGRMAFNEWAINGMEGDPEEYAIKKLAELVSTNLVRFEMVQTEGKYGTYFYLQSSFKLAVTPFELAAVKTAKEIYEGQQTGLDYCTDLRLVANEQQCLEPVEEVKSNTKSKRLKAA